MNKKPLNMKSYGSIGHLPNSRMGSGDHHCHEGQAVIATVKVRDKHDRVIVQEKLDGSNVGIAKIEDQIYPITRSGYLANTSNYEHHHIFYDWVMKQQNRFLELLENNERLCGEWLHQAHGTIYTLPHEPFVAFDIMRKHERTVYDLFKERVEKYDIIVPKLISHGQSFSVEEAMKAIEISGHGAIDPVEGCVWRVERNKVINRATGERKWEVDFLTKYVRPDKIDGCYLMNKDHLIVNTYEMLI